MLGKTLGPDKNWWCVRLQSCSYIQHTSNLQVILLTYFIVKIFNTWFVCIRYKPNYSVYSMCSPVYILHPFPLPLQTLHHSHTGKDITSGRDVKKYRNAYLFTNTFTSSKCGVFFLCCSFFSRIFSILPNFYVA